MKRCNYLRKTIGMSDKEFTYDYSCTVNGGKFCRVSKEECEQLCKLCKEGQK